MNRKGRRGFRRGTQRKAFLSDLCGKLCDLCGLAGLKIAHLEPSGESRLNAAEEMPDARLQISRTPYEQKFENASPNFEFKLTTFKICSECVRSEPVLKRFDAVNLDNRDFVLVSRRQVRVVVDIDLLQGVELGAIRRGHLLLHFVTKMTARPRVENYLSFFAR